MGLALIALWIGRRHFASVFQVAWRRNGPEEDPTDEPLSYRAAVAGLLLGFALLTLFAWKAGMSVWAAAIFLVLYLMTEVGISRVRAEIGSPTHDLHFAGPEVLMVDALGTRRLGPRSLTVVSFYWFLTRAHYSDVMPHQLEAYHMADRARMKHRQMTVALVIGLVVATLVAFVVLVSEGYRNRTVFSWLVQPREPDMVGVGYFAGGVLFTVFLMLMRTRFLWWPLHPAGYAVSSTYQMRSFWSLFLLAWLCKWVIVRWGGVRGLRTATPFFLGMVLAEFVIGSFWSLIGALYGIRTFGIV